MLKGVTMLYMALHLSKTFHKFDTFCPNFPRYGVRVAQIIICDVKFWGGGMGVQTIRRHLV